MLWFDACQSITQNQVIGSYATSASLRVIVQFFGQAQRELSDHKYK